MSFFCCRILSPTLLTVKVLTFLIFNDLGSFEGQGPGVLQKAFLWGFALFLSWLDWAMGFWKEGMEVTCCSYDIISREIQHHWDSEHWASGGPSWVRAQSSTKPSLQTPSQAQESPGHPPF